MINYKDLVDREFIRVDPICQVHFNEFGTYPVIMYKTLFSRHKLKYELHWHSSDKVLDLHAINKEGDIKKSIKDITIKQLDDFLFFAR